MKKSLIALAVAGALAAPVVAMADATVYGQANVSFDAVSNGALVSSSSANNVSSNVSRLGFKGNEDLGDGLSAVWQIEQAIAFDNNPIVAPSAGTLVVSGSNTFANRDTFAGLSSASMGTVIMGIHDTPYKMATRGFDLFADTIADNRSIMGPIHDARLSNVVAYISPAMSGFTVAVATTAGAETPLSPSTKGSAWSLAGLYGAGPLNVNFGYQTITGGTAGTGTLGAAGIPVNDKANAWKLGGSYAMDAFQVNVIYEKTGSSGTIGNAFDRSAWYLGGKYNVSANDAVKLAYNSAGKTNSVVDSDANQISLGYDHNLSKRTSVYALYSKINNKGTGLVNQAAYTFSQATSASAANGGISADPSVLSVGMKHAF